MNNIIICCGISGSGKSSWSAQFIKDNSNYLRINRDDLRRVMVGDLINYYTNTKLHRVEQLVNALEDPILELYLNNNINIIIDNTNLTQKCIKKWISKIDSWNVNKNNKYSISFKLFDCELIKAKSRVYQRDYSSADNITKIDYINKQHQQYQLIKKWILETYPNNIIT